jgi:hypothetical protein
VLSNHDTLFVPHNASSLVGWASCGCYFRSRSCPARARHKSTHSRLARDGSISLAFIRYDGRGSRLGQRRRALFTHNVSVLTVTINHHTLLSDWHRCKGTLTCARCLLKAGRTRLRGIDGDARLLPLHSRGVLVTMAWCTCFQRQPKHVRDHCTKFAF